MLKGRRKSGPTWLPVLQMAEEWGTPPWEIVKAPGSLRWAARWSAYKKAEAAARPKPMKKKT